MIKNKIATIFLFTTITLFLSGCSVLHKENRYRSTNEKIKEIVYYDCKELKENWIKYINPLYVDSNLDLNVKQVSDETSIKVEWSSKKAFFDLGKYDLQQLQIYNKQEPLSFIIYLSDFIKHIKKDLVAAGIETDITLSLVFYGQADGTPCGRHLKYNGVYGPSVTMNKKITNLGGTPHSFKIKKNQTISNEELAALRAYSFYYYLNSYLSQINFQKKYEISVVNKPGMQYRTASVKIKIREKK